jgi:hypothetical protein
MGRSKKCQFMDQSTWPACIECGEPAGWSVGWLYPTKEDACAETADVRPCCTVKCAIAVRAADKRITYADSQNRKEGAR